MIAEPLNPAPRRPPNGFGNGCALAGLPALEEELCLLSEEVPFEGGKPAVVYCEGNGAFMRAGEA